MHDVPFACITSSTSGAWYDARGVFGGGPAMSFATSRSSLDGSSMAASVHGAAPRRANKNRIADR